MSAGGARILCQFSCGAASAVAAKIALSRYGGRCEIINAYLKNEHIDNRRFLADCERWFGRPVTVLRDEKYGADIVQVFRREQFMKSRFGAPCSRQLKRKLLGSLEKPGDIMVLGFTVEEQDRMEDFIDRNPSRPALAPLIEAGLTKDDCKAMVERAGIALPAMYLLGYENANCIGCVKGGKGYWRAIREDFPQAFEELAAVQEEIGVGANFHLSKDRTHRISLRELGDGPISRNEAIPSCSFFCEIAEKEYSA